MSSSPSFPPGPSPSDESSDEAFRLLPPDSPPEAVEQERFWLPRVRRLPPRPGDEYRYNLRQWFCLLIAFCVGLGLERFFPIGYFAAVVCCVTFLCILYAELLAPSSSLLGYIYWLFIPLTLGAILTAIIRAAEMHAAHVPLG